MAKDTSQIPEDKLALYIKLLDTHPDIELKGGQKLPYTSYNGNMFTFLTKEGRVGLRLSKEEREDFIEKYNTKLAENYGAVMKEYVEVPNELLSNTDELQAYLALSYAYVQTLKSKPTKKKKK